MMSATIAHNNYVVTTAEKTALIMTAIIEHTNIMLNKIEKLINQYSQKGCPSLTLSFPVNSRIIKCEELNDTSSFWQCEKKDNVYKISLHTTIKEDYTAVEMPITDQQNLILNVLREAGYKTTFINNNWKVSWA